jgi:hypothetical protein
LLCRILDVHSKISMACDPLLPWFKSLRNAIGENTFAYDWQGGNEPLLDYYYNKKNNELLESILKTDLEIQIPKEDQGENLNKRISKRMEAECCDLISVLPDLQESNYGDWINDFFHSMKQIRRSQGSIMGIKEPWISEFFPALFRNDNSSRFILIFRDPRAVLASMYKADMNGYEKIGQPLSVLRHWRKQANLFSIYSKDAELSSKIHMLRYEDLVNDPISTIKQLIHKIDLNFEDSMIDTNRFTGYSESATPAGNSSYETIQSGIQKWPIDRWRDTLPDHLKQLCELVCGQEMIELGYPMEIVEPRQLNWINEYELWEKNKEFSWRTDMENLLADIALEILRQEVIDGKKIVDDSIIKQLFYKQEVLKDLQKVNKP